MLIQLGFIVLIKALGLRFQGRIEEVLGQFHRFISVSLQLETGVTDFMKLDQFCIDRVARVLVMEVFDELDFLPLIE
ncbi:hypothetical protein [Pseudomonas cremoricolorata]|uniref:hypothetical protein n=1 Tax=Pseudomonas cremoricolorata TaxID=157783 RepID=UPI0012B5868A|nr:hypothetical protein [Pseudomonas cremoricolorata]